MLEADHHTLTNAISRWSKSEKKKVKAKDFRRLSSKIVKGLQKVDCPKYLRVAGYSSQIRIQYKTHLFETTRGKLLIDIKLVEGSTFVVDDESPKEIQEIAEELITVNETMRIPMRVIERQSRDMYEFLESHSKEETLEEYPQLKGCLKGQF